MTKRAKDSRKAKSDFEAVFKVATKTAGLLDKAAMATGVVLAEVCSGFAAVKDRATEILDERVINRLLSQYDRLVETTGFTHQEALDAVTTLVRRRLETAVKERSQK